MPAIMIVIASVRPVRAGKPVGDWVVAGLDGRDVRVDVADLAVLGLPFMDEPRHPRLRQYSHQHTLDWSARVDAADAFVFVTPEYNFSFAPALKSALDYLLHEWGGKHVAFVSYGGVSAGLRGVTALASALQALGLIWTQSVSIPWVGKQIHDGVFEPSDSQVKALATTLDNIIDLAGAHAARR